MWTGRELKEDWRWSKGRKREDTDDKQIMKLRWDRLGALMKGALPNDSNWNGTSGRRTTCAVCGTHTDRHCARRQTGRFAWLTTLSLSLFQFQVQEFTPKLCASVWTDWQRIVRHLPTLPSSRSVACRALLFPFFVHTKSKLSFFTVAVSCTKIKVYFTNDVNFELSQCRCLCSLFLSFPQVPITSCLVSCYPLPHPPHSLHLSIINVNVMKRYHQSDSYESLSLSLSPGTVLTQAHRVSTVLSHKQCTNEIKITFAAYVPRPPCSRELVSFILSVTLRLFDQILQCLSFSSIVISLICTIAFKWHILYAFFILPYWI